MDLGRPSSPAVGVLGLVLVLLATSSLAQTNNTTDIDTNTQLDTRQLSQTIQPPYITCPGLYNQLFQDSSDCSSYYECNNNQLTKRRCPSGQVYNPATRACGVYPPPGGCQTTDAPRATATFKTAMIVPVFTCVPTIRPIDMNALTANCSTPALGRAATSTTLSVATGNTIHQGHLVRSAAPRRAVSSKMPVIAPDIMCVPTGMPREWPGQLFDPLRRSCGNINDPDNCQMPSGWRPAGGTGWVSGSFRCTQASGQFQDTSDCSRYYVCTNWNAQRMACPTGQLFDPLRRSCGNINDPDNCQMPSGWRPAGGTGWISGSFRCTQASGRFQDTSDCSRYYVCTNWNAQRMACPTGQLFDPFRRSCGNINDPDNCQMPSDWRPAGGAGWTGLISGSFRCTQASGRFQDASDCSRYYLCANWNAQRMACPTGQLFDPFRRSCGNINNPDNCQMPSNWRPAGGTGWTGQTSGSCKQLYCPVDFVKTFHFFNYGETKAF
ncbi:chondroitin proteoglycan 2 [Elysia marginata]|uniref:Chondroitin proteoglycan 2 n=1 Tax=Elysia marginata TaxID=1093978 RepID=A0AAV4IJG3_9GAST|nr:chondroitin proteoglycan 2 [Elysia marginata]